MKHHPVTPPSRWFRKLSEGERLVNEGKEPGRGARTPRISEATWNRWRNQYGRMKVEDAKLLKDLEVENARLKKIEANQGAQHGHAEGAVRVKLLTF